MTSGRREQPLGRPELLEAALRLVDSEGLPALTMRRLADAVGVEAMSLYHHVPNKDVLLDWTVDLMRSEMRLPDPLPGDWENLMATIFREYRRVLAAHPNMLPLATRRTDGLALSGLQYLIDSGFQPGDAVELYQSLAAFTVGYSMLSAPSAQADWSPSSQELAARSHEWRDETCERTLRMILDGYASRRRTNPGSLPLAETATRMD
jgi:AcrR family transcriptional regulator